MKSIAAPDREDAREDECDRDDCKHDGAAYRIGVAQSAKVLIGSDPATAVCRPGVCAVNSSELLRALSKGDAGRIELVGKAREEPQRQKCRRHDRERARVTHRQVESFRFQIEFDQNIGPADSTEYADVVIRRRIAGEIRLPR